MKRVVVTGLGAITPVGNDVMSMWENIKNGVCGIDRITKIDTTELKVKLAGEVKDFNPLLYMDKNEVKKTDLFCQYGIAAATQAINDSKIIDNIEPERFGVYIGSGIGGMNTFINETEKMLTKGVKRVSPHFVPMLMSNALPAAIAIKYNAQGPCMSIVTACATGTNSIGEAFRAIKGGYADAIITGGSEATITDLGLAGFSNMLALALTENRLEASIPFDKRRSGFVMGEAAGILILEEYEHAINRGAKIYAEISGYGFTCDAHHITAPNTEGTIAGRAMKLALEETGKSDIAPDKIYINAHGTSTPFNDLTETNAIKKAFGEKAYDIYISSTKSMTGHMLGAAGAVEAIISILALRDGTIPPTIGLNEKDPECDLNYVPNVKISKDIEIALSNSLGFGGHNACIAIEKYVQKN